MVLWFTMVSRIVLNLSFVCDDRVEAMLIRGVCDGLQTTIRQVDIVDALGNVSFFFLFVAKPCAMIRIFYFVDKSVAVTSLMMVVVRITVMFQCIVMIVKNRSMMDIMTIMM